MKKIEKNNVKTVLSGFCGLGMLVCTGCASLVAEDENGRKVMYKDTTAVDKTMEVVEDVALLPVRVGGAALKQVGQLAKDVTPLAAVTAPAAAEITCGVLQHDINRRVINKFGHHGCYVVRPHAAPTVVRRTRVIYRGHSY